MSFPGILVSSIAFRKSSVERIFAYVSMLFIPSFWLPVERILAAIFVSPTARSVSLYSSLSFTCAAYSLGTINHTTIAITDAIAVEMIYCFLNGKEYITVLRKTCQYSCISKRHLLLLLLRKRTMRG